MGREAECSYQWQGQSGSGKAVLEAEEIVLRGTIKTRIARTAIFAAETRADDLILMVQGTPLVLQLGAVEAGRWITALRKPIPSLAQKLGINPDNPAHLIGVCDIAALTDALQGAAVLRPEKAKMLIAMLHHETDLDVTMTLAKTLPDRPVWCVHRKGRAGAVTDTMVREFMNAHGYRDSKSCSVSTDWTATRYAATRS